MRLQRFTIGALTYLAVSMLWLYGFVDQGRLEGSDWRTWSLVAVVLGLHVAFGWAIREWAAILLPLAVVFLAFPAGYPESQFSEPLPVWIGQAFFAVVEIPAIVCGVILWRLYDYWRRTPSPSR